MTLYVGIDISKDKFDVSFTVNGEVFGHETITNDKLGFKYLLKQAKNHRKKLKVEQIHFCMEATGIYHCGLCEFLQESSEKHSALVSVVNPVRTKSFSKSLMLRTKNDKVDSQMLAQYAFFHKPPMTPKTPENIKKFRALIRYQETLIKNRTQEIARFKSSLDKEIQKLIQKNIDFIEKQLKEIIEKIKDLVKSDEFLKKQICLLKTIDGIGDKVAWKLIAELKFDDPENISPKAQVAHAGLSPREYSSGSSVKGRTHISKMGNSGIRKVLYLPALGCLKNENHFTPFYKRLIENGKSHRQTQVAVMRKMVLIAAAVLKNQQPFDPNWAQKTQQKHEEALMQKIA
jgi:transposase